MRITLKFTDGNARRTFYFLNERYQTKLQFNEKNFEKLAKIAVLTESANEAKIHLERLDKIMPAIMADEGE